MPQGQRKTDRLFTIDRALLLLAISAGMWAGAAGMKADHQAARLSTVEQRQDQAMREKAHAELGTTRELAIVTTRLNEIDRRTENIEKTMSVLATSTGELGRATARLANAVKDPQQ